MTCVERCETWQVKKELRRTNQVLAKSDHKLAVFNALKNERRLALLQALKKQAFTLEELQRKLKDSGYRHSQNTIEEYLKKLQTAGLIQVKRKWFMLTLYGEKIHDAVVRFDFRGHLPTYSEGYEERVLRTLLQGVKTRAELSDMVPEKSLPRTLRRLLNRKLIMNNSPAARVFYFRTKRALSLEQLSPTQKKICQAIPADGASANELADAVGISLRRVYKYLRSLRGKKLVFRRTRSRRFALSQRGRQLAEFVDTVESIK
jgi:predicted transcriptional regulator